MLEKMLNRVMLGAKTPEGKIVTILLTLSLALMTWNATSIDTAFAGDGAEETSLVATDDDAANAGGDEAAQAEEAEDASGTAADEPAVEPVVPEGDTGSGDVSGGEGAGEASGDEGEAAPADEPSKAGEDADEPGNAAEDDEASDKADADSAKDGTTSEDAEERADEELPAVAEYPAQFFGDSVGGVAVSAEASAGALPAGAKMQLTESSVSPDAVQSAVEGTIESVAAVDISFTDAAGKTVAPLADVTVTMSGATVLAGQKLYAVHLAGGAVRMAESNSGSVMFTTTEFSPYALVVTTPSADEGAATKDTTAKRNAKAAGDEAAETITVTFEMTTDPDEPVAPVTIEVESGQAIGDKLPATPEVPGYITKWVKKGTTEVVTADTVVTEPFTVAVAMDKIIYTVTFVQEDGTRATRTTSIDDGFAVNDLPEVTPKTNKVGKWVYPGTTNEFTVGTVVSSDLTVNAYYDQNIFTVKFMVDDALYEEMTTATGTAIVLPSDPIKAGADFMGWFTEPGGQGTQYTAESTVSEDLTLHAFFSNQVRVRFLVKDDDGEIISEKSQFFVDLSAGEKIETLPEDPFVEGKAFDHWKNETTGDTVTVGYTVTDSFDAVAVFNKIDTYKLTVKYYYMHNGTRHDIQDQVYVLADSNFTEGGHVYGDRSWLYDCF